MKLDARSTLAQVAVAVGDALRRHKIHAVLTGGACASLYTSGAGISDDVDFVLSGHVTRERLDEAMTAAGFKRRKEHYVHPGVPFYVDFPRGPLAVGSDLGVRPVRRHDRHGETLTLSATDACRDRLAAFYHWNDRQSCAVAVRIALENVVGLARIRRWSTEERATDKFEEFRRQLEKARQRRRR